jgi:type VI secretion system protein ImpK
MAHAREGRAAPVTATGPRHGQLALALQEALTAIVRLRGDRNEVTDPETFRQQFKQVLSAGHEDARRAGYSSEDVKLAVFAVVVLLDESALQSRQGAFGEWARRPLQEELFGEHVGGDSFYERIRELLGRADVDRAADVLEVYVLCLLLGFRGRYSGGGEAERQHWIATASQRIGQSRGTRATLCPAWAPPAQERIQPPADPWVLRLALGAAACIVIALVLFLVFEVSLRGSVAAVRALAVPLP